MKIILYMAITPNGFSAKEDGNSDWVSPAEASGFLKICKHAGVVIMGRKTFDLLNPDWLPLKNDGLHIVLSHTNHTNSEHPAITFRNQSVPDLVHWLEANKCPEAVIIGGPSTSGQFIQSNLIDEMFIDLEPLVFGRGIPLFTPGDFERKLKLLETTRFSSGTIQLHYQVIK